MKRKEQTTASIIESEADSPQSAPNEVGDVSARLSAVHAAHAAGIAAMPLLSRDKRPAQKGWQKAAMPTLEEVEAWARKANIGFRTGSVSGGLIVIDLDPGADISDLGELPRTVTVLTGRTDDATGRRGTHLYFRTATLLTNSAAKLGAHIDTRGEGGYVVAPGSIHPETGAMYEFATGLGLGEVEIADLPQHLIDLLEAKPSVAPTSEDATTTEWIDQVPLSLRLEAGKVLISQAEPAVSGDGGHAATFKVACSLVIRCGLPYESVLELMQEFNNKCTPPWSLPDLEHKCKDAGKLFEVAPSKDVGVELVPVARAVVESLGVSVLQVGNELVLTRGTEVEKCRGGKSDRSEKRVFVALTKLLPEIPKAVLSAAASSFVNEPPVAKNEDHNPDVFLVSAMRLSETSPDIQGKAMEFAKAPDLLDRVRSSYKALGLVGLGDQCEMLYLAATSRILEKPIYILARGERCTGKSILNSLTGKMMPSEAVRTFSQITAKALLYLPVGAIKHRLIIAGERTHEAKDSLGESTQILRELLSEGRASQFSVDGGDGGRIGVERVVEGPIGFIQSTTSDHIFAEDLSRMYQVWLAPTDTDRKVIGKSNLLQAQGLEGSGAESARTVELHHCFQRMLKPYEVVLPQSDEAERLLEVWPPSDIDFPRKIRSLIELVKVITLVHQFQRMKDSQGRLVANDADIQLAIGLMVRLNLMEDKAVFGADKLGNLRKIWMVKEVREFAVADVVTMFEVQPRTARRWLERWCAAGLIRCTKDAMGTTPASYVITKLGKESLGFTEPTAVAA